MASKNVDFIPVTDPLLRNPRLAYVTELPVVGIPVRFETNSAYVRDVVDETFGAWRSIADSSRTAKTRTARVQLVVVDGSEGDDEQAPQVSHICPDETRVITRTHGSVALVDPERAETLAYVTTALAANRSFFRHAFLEAVTLALITHFDRHPIHASAIARGSRALLLTGPPGSGKSTLAYSAHLAGLDVLSDDTVWVQLEPHFRLWGSPWTLHLTPDSTRFFPDLANAAGTLEMNGQSKVPVDLRGRAGAPIVTNEAMVCVLDRGSAKPSLERLSRDDLKRALTQQLTMGYDRYPGRLDASVESLAAHGGWRLALSNDPREALPFLLQMLEA